MFDISGKALNFGANILEENNYFGLSFWETAPGQCQALRKFEIFVLNYGIILRHNLAVNYGT